MNDHNRIFSGAHTALVTPFTRSGDALDIDHFDAQIRFQASGGVRGIVVCGTTGETPTLDAAERRTVIARAVEVGRPLGLLVTAGAGSNSTAKAMDLQREAEQLGADATLQVVPYYNRPSQEGLYRHFHALADVAQVPIVLYDVPGRTGTGLTVETVCRLADHENIVAIKSASGMLDDVSRLVRETDLAVLSGDDSLTLSIQALGGVGVVSVISNLLPDQVRNLVDAMNRGDLVAGRIAHDHLHALAMGLCSLDSNPVPVKAAMAMLGRDSGVVRPPLASLAEPAQRALRELLASAGFEIETAGDRVQAEA